MRRFLFQPFDEVGGFDMPQTLSFADAPAALAYALSPTFPRGCEIWDGYRFLGRFCGPRLVSPHNAMTEGAPHGLDQQIGKCA
jgi:hypothetical protein